MTEYPQPEDIGRVDCERCGALPYQWCVTASGHVAATFHRVRGERAAAMLASGALRPLGVVRMLLWHNLQATR